MLKRIDTLKPTNYFDQTNQTDCPQKILIVLHQESSTPGRVGLKLQHLGFKLDIRRPALGDDLPDTLSGYKAAVIFGGPNSANDPDEFIKREIDWINVPLKEDVPFLGICLGAQMMVKQLGGQVDKHPEGKVEVGYYPIRATEVAQQELDWPSIVYQWHKEGFTLPDGAKLLAVGDDFENQAYQYGDNAYGFQFHPELTLAMMHRWTVKASERFLLPNAKQRDEHFTGRALYDHQTVQWLDQFLTKWLQLEKISSDLA